MTADTRPGSGAHESEPDTFHCPSASGPLWLGQPPPLAGAALLLRAPDATAQPALPVVAPAGGARPLYACDQLLPGLAAPAARARLARAGVALRQPCA